MSTSDRRRRDLRPSACGLARCARYAALAGLLTALSPACLAAADEAMPQPGEVRCRPTWCCMGINWHVANPEDLSGSVAVEFRRKGTSDWRPALPMMRHLHGNTTMFSGSVFRLAPGTEYEFRLTMKKPDGGTVAKTVSARTLDYPQMPSRTVAVPTGGIAAAQEKAAPGTVMLLGRGTYPAVRLDKPGKSGAWIVYKPAGDGEVVIEGRTEIRADYVWLHGLTLRDPKNAVQGSHKGVCITNCRIHSHYAIHTGRGGENYFIADNYLKGDANSLFSFSGEGVDFGSDRGLCGHAVCFNEITDFADGVSYGRGDIDVYNNYIHETVDDFIEPDYARENYRLWSNRCYNSMCGFSFQPMKGGPWYIFDNVNVGAYLHALKVKDITGASMIVGNTMLTKSSRLGQGGDILRGSILNNVWLRATPGPLASSGRFRPGISPVRVDHNAYGTGGGEPWSSIKYADLAKQHGWDRHSIHVDYRDVFQDEVKLPAGKPYYSSNLKGNPIPPDWHFAHYLLLPKEGSKLIDAGAALPNITGPYLGKAPDLGAHELGLGTAWYGRRTWDEESGLIYGLPEGWKKAAPVKGDRREAAGPGGRKKAAMLTCQSPPVFAMMQVEPAEGEARWARARQVVSDDAGALTNVLEFQDGLYARLYGKGDNALLIAQRVEPDGVLHVVVSCRQTDLPKARLGMFQFVRSLVR